MHISEFHYRLPERLIARYPLPCRTDSRLLRLDARRGTCDDHRFGELPGLLEPGDLLVFNNSRVVPARLVGRKPTGGRVEVLLERVLAPRRALAQVHCRRKLREGGSILLDAPAPVLRAINRQGEFWLLEAVGALDFPALLERYGRVPLPPYLGRQDEPLDRERYQTVYARHPGSVAAPTAGLHFTPELLEELGQRGVGFAWLTLHVGSGTFQPIRTESVEEHRMHEEWMELDAALCAQVAATRRASGRVVAVGTTSLRALESAARNGFVPQRCMTRLYITPGFRFQVVDALITNFHLPGSSLLVLAAAFAGRETLLRAYQHAIEHEYRFYSYGDAMFIHGSRRSNQRASG